MERLRRIHILSVLALLAMMCVVTALPPTEASASNTCQTPWWPHQGAIRSALLNGTYSVTLEFKLSQAEANNLRCVSELLELDFHLSGFNLPPQWEGYTASSNLPGAVHDTALSDFTVATPGLTRIFTNQLVAGANYFAAISWSASTTSSTPSVSVNWVPSYWADMRNPLEADLCIMAIQLNLTGYEGYCVFGEGANTFLLTSQFFPSHEDGLPFGSILQQFTFGEWDNSANQPQQLYHGYVPDGLIVQNTSGSNLYSAAGGRLFWFNQSNAALREALLTQRRERYGEVPFLVMADEEIHAVEVNRDSAGTYVPGAHMPADNTFLLEYGNPTQYVVKYQHPFAIGSTDEVTALGGANRAIMVPTSISDLSQYPAQWVQNDLLQFYGDPTVWHYAGDRGFRVPSVPTRDCLSVRHHRGVTLMPSSAWNVFPTHPTQQAACDFTHGQVLVGQPSQRQVIVLYGAGFSIGSPQEATAIGAANQAVPVADETVDGLLARTPSIPQGHVFRAGLQTQAYHYVNATFSPIGSPATRDCLLVRDGLGTGEEVVPGSFIARYPVGNPAYCELENRQLLAPNGVNVGYVKDGYNRPVTNPTIRDCIAVRTGAGQPLQVSSNVWNSYTPGPNAYCPYEREPGLNFVKDPAYPNIVWLVGPATGSTPGVKRHAGSLCVPDPYTTPIKAAHVFTVPAGETAGHTQGPDWWPSGADCQALPQG